MTLQYNISISQPERPVSPTRSSLWISGGAIAGALALHGLAAAALFLLATPQGAAIDDAVIAVFVDPAAVPVATATESASQPPPEPEVAAAAPTESALQEAVPPPEPMESLAPPDFTQQPPPPPPPRVESPKPAPVAPIQKVEPKRAPPARAATPAPAPAPGPAPGTVAPSAPAAGPPAAPSVAPGWNALLAAWLAAHRRYPEEARRRSQEGDVTVRFTVAADGRVSGVNVTSGSGFSALDAAALATLQGATVPAPGVEATRTVRIRFRLGD